MRIREFKALRPPLELTDMVASVPYDTVSTEEARKLAEGNKFSFLRIILPEIDIQENADINSEALYRKAFDNFSEFQEEGILIREQEPCLYLYKQKMGNHVQRGIVACCHIDDYINNIIRKHEKTRKDKEDNRTKHLKTLNANTGPVFLTYRDSKDIDDIVASEERMKPLFELTTYDGVVHTVWRITAYNKLTELFLDVSKCYIADGHHRTAAAVRTGIEKRRINKNHTDKEEYNWFLAVLFPASQLQILPYNRFVSDLGNMTEDDFLKAVKAEFIVEDNGNSEPSRPGQISMYLGRKWYGLTWNNENDIVNRERNDPVSLLDVSFLNDHLLDPILGIKDPRTDSRIKFIGGIRGTDELVERVNSGNAAVAFSMYPVTVDQMMAIADAGRIMPPKSTWFEPKLRSGLFVHTL